MKYTESMALAGMNPMVGTSTNAGSMLVNVMNRDKDLDNDGGAISGDCIALADKLGTDDNLYGLDVNGKITKAHRYDIMRKPEITHGFVIEDTEDNNNILEHIREEAEMDYNDRPVHEPNYFYEVFTGRKLLTEDQMEYDPNLIKVDMDTIREVVGYNLNKFSAVASGEEDNIDPPKTEKSSNYTPDRDYPQGNKNFDNPSKVIESWDPNERFHIDF